MYGNKWTKNVQCEIYEKMTCSAKKGIVETTADFDPEKLVFQDFFYETKHHNFFTVF